jgi:hypothetical protein
MSDPIPQITVLVSIVRVNDGFDVFYTYEDPESGQAVVKFPACILDAPVPYYSLFTLDYQSSLDGWTFVDLSPKPGGTAPSYSLSSNMLSLITLDDGTASLRFDLSFLNVKTNEKKNDDPQENNVPKPK